MAVTLMAVVSATGVSAATTLRLVDPSNAATVNTASIGRDAMRHPGDTFALELWAKTDTFISGVGCYWQYDSTRLELCSLSGSMYWAVYPDTSVFGDTPLINSSSNDTIYYAVTTTADSMTGDARVATMYFRIKSYGTAYGDTALVRWLFDSANNHESAVGSGTDSSATSELTGVDTGAVYVRKKWSYLVYLDGDNNLEADALADFIEMAAVGSGDTLSIVVQLDRAAAEATTYGDWTDCRRFYVQNGNTPLAATALTSLGEVNMGDSNVLADFLEWALATYPADSYALVFWDHGGGWRAPGPETPKTRAVCWDDGSGGDCLYMAEVREAMTEAGTVFDVVDFDVCLAGMFEVGYEMRNVARYVVASELTEPGAGNPYTAILAPLNADPDTTPAAFAVLSAYAYMQSYASASDAVTKRHGISPKSMCWRHR